MLIQKIIIDNLVNLSLIFSFLDNNQTKSDGRIRQIEFAETAPIILKMNPIFLTVTAITYMISSNNVVNPI